MMAIKALGFDADDTLWHNESIFRVTQSRFTALLGDHAGEEDVVARLVEAERRNLAFYGYGVKGFTLSMIETAHAVCGDDLPPAAVREILDYGREMLTHPVDCLPGAAEALAALAPDHEMILITKGDLFDQERKLAQSGLGDLFDAVEIVSEKTAATYLSAFARHGVGPESALMTGNSLKSDVIPALEAGAWGVHIPYHVTWAHEMAPEPVGRPRYRALDRIDALPALIEGLA
ncbi:HAD family hydrolase [Rhodovulum sp. DZ06]|uniref:HAD family hydrolase n=1 Tax=Rhodovulum sp. DZ06 TaxID=3425126 RepID=UPI003D34C055